MVTAASRGWLTNKHGNGAKNPIWTIQVSFQNIDGMNVKFLKQSLHLKIYNILCLQHKVADSTIILHKMMANSTCPSSTQHEVIMHTHNEQGTIWKTYHSQNNLHLWLTGRFSNNLLLVAPIFTVFVTGMSIYFLLI